MKRKFILNLIFAVGINLLIKPFWVLGVERSVQLAVGSEAYGFYFALFNFSFLFNMILDFGINNYNTTFISRYPQLLPKKFSQLVILKGILAFLYIVITIVMGFIAQYNNLQMQLLMILCVNQILSFAISYVRTNVSALHFFATDSLLSVLDRLLMIVFCGLLLWGNIAGPMRLSWFVLAQTTSYSLTLLICILVLKPHLQGLQWKWNKAFTVHLLRKSYPYAVLGIVMGIYTKMDGVLIERLLPEGNLAAGHYASAYRLFDAGNMIAVVFAGLLLPIFSRLIQHKDDPAPLLELSFTLIVIPALLLASVCFFYNAEIIFWLNKAANPEIEQVLSLLIVSFIFTCTVYIYGTYLTAASSIRLLNKIALWACLINILLNFLLIRVYGITGAAITAVITQGFVAVCHYYYVHRQFQIAFNFSFLLKLSIIAVLQLVFPFFLKELAMHFAAKIFMQAACTSIAVLALKLVETEQIKKIFVRG